MWTFELRCPAIAPTDEFNVTSIILFLMSLHFYDKAQVFLSGTPVLRKVSRISTRLYCRIRFSSLTSSYQEKIWKKNYLRRERENTFLTSVISPTNTQMGSYSSFTRQKGRSCIQVFQTGIFKTNRYLHQWKGVAFSTGILSDCTPKPFLLVRSHLSIVT